MTDAHPEIGAELRQLAQAILDRLDPALRSAAARATAGGAGACQQVWCPVCALGALVNGEQHPLLTVIAEHSMALLAVVRAVANSAEPPAGRQQPPRSESPAAPTSPRGPVEAADDPPPPSVPGHYQSIPITVEDVATRPDRAD